MPIKPRNRHRVEEINLNDPGTMPHQLLNACECLAHYHLHHTSDKITRFGSKDGDAPEIIIVSDAEWKVKLREFLKEAFPDAI